MYSTRSATIIIKKTDTLIYFLCFRFSLSNVASNGDDIALIRLPRLAVTVDENAEDPVMPVCLPWKLR